jgi:hypothetical protein
MKLWDTILLCLAAAFLLISAFEIWARGISFAYWSIMLSIVFFFWFTYRKR